MLGVVTSKGKGSLWDKNPSAVRRSTIKVVAPAATPGIVPVIVASFHTEIGAVAPATSTRVLTPAYVPKPVPVKVNGTPIGPEAMDSAGTSGVTV